MKLVRPLTAIAAMALSLLAISVHARSFECTTTDGAYRPPGAIALASAVERDKSLVGSVFKVETSVSKVTGSALFQTNDQRVEVLTNSNEEFQILWRSKHDDLTTLRMSKSKEGWFFSYYNSWQSLLLAGRCREV